MQISIAQNVAGQTQELLQISCIFFANWFAFCLAFCCILILDIAMGLQFFIIFAFFCILILGSYFPVAFFLHFFSKISFLLFSRKRQQPDDHTRFLSCRSKELHGSLPVIRPRNCCGQGLLSQQEQGSTGLDQLPSTIFQIAQEDTPCDHKLHTWGLRYHSRNSTDNRIGARETT